MLIGLALSLQLSALSFSFEGFCNQDKTRHLPLRKMLTFRRSSGGCCYGIFLSTSLLVVSLVLTTPDIWVCALTYLAAGLVLRIYLSRGNWFYFGALGLVLGCAYLTKSFYFPLSFVFLGVAWLATGNLRKNSPQAILALVVFMAVAGPFVLALSLAKHRFTFGDTGKLAYVIMVGDVAQPQFWHGESGTGAPVHPTRQILDIPRIYEFGAPVSGSYPLTTIYPTGWRVRKLSFI